MTVRADGRVMSRLALLLVVSGLSACCAVPSRTSTPPTPAPVYPELEFPDPLGVTSIAGG